MAAALLPVTRRLAHPSASCTQAAAVQPAALPAMPEWAVQLDKPGESRRQSFAYNRKTVSEVNSEGRQLDFVMWGDSLTAALQFKYRDTW